MCELLHTGGSKNANRLQVDPHQITRHLQRTLIGPPDIRHDILHELRPDEVNRHVPCQMFSQHGIGRVEMAEVGGDHRFGSGGNSDLAEIMRTGMRPCPDARFTAKVDCLLRERAFVNEKIAILRQLDQPMQGDVSPLNTTDSPSVVSIRSPKQGDISRGMCST